MGVVAIFIDGGYIEKVLKNEFTNFQIDFELFAKEIANIISSDNEILRTYYYNSLPYKGNPPSDEESDRFAKRQSFYDALNKKSRFDVKLGRLSKRGPDRDGNYFYEQKMVDALLSIDLVHLSAKGKITYAALIAGDGDFVPAIKVAKEEGVIIWLFHGQKKHAELWQTADERVLLQEDFIKKVRFKK